MSRKQVNSGERNTRINHNNRANQLNPNNDTYWKSRGYDGKPCDKNNVSTTRKNKD